MNDLFTRSNQLKSLKHRYILQSNLFILSYFLNFSVVFIYLIGYSFSIKGMKALSFLYLNKIEVVLITFLLILLYVPLVLLHIKVNKKNNHKFHQKYLNYLFKECNLEDIIYVFRKRNLDISSFEGIEPYFSINNLKLIYSLSDVSPNYVFNYFQITYMKDNKKHYGVLLIVDLKENLDGFFQIRTYGEPNKLDYEGKKIIRFGFTSKSTLSKFQIFSSLGSKTYDFDHKDLDKIILEYNSYLKSEFIITYIGNRIYILIMDFQFNLTSSYLSYKSFDFDRKINSLIRLHKLTDELISSLKSYKA